MYNCNALSCLYVTMATAAVLHLTHTFRLTTIIDNYGHLMTVANIYGFAVSFGMYFITVARGKQIRMSGNFIYDVFMGAALNPRIGSVDLKMWAEVRIPWNIVFFLAISGACKQYEQYGYVTPVCRFFVSSPYVLTSSVRTWPSCALRHGCMSMPGQSTYQYIYTALWLMVCVTVERVKSAFLKLGTCFTRNGASWSFFGTSLVFLL